MFRLVLFAAIAYGRSEIHLDAVTALVAHASDSTMSERHQSPRVRVPRGGALGPHIPRAVRAWLRSLVAVRGLLRAAGAARGPRSTPRCPPAPPVVRRRPATRRPRYVRGYGVETKRYYELVYLVRYRYRGTGTSQLSAAAQRL